MKNCTLCISQRMKRETSTQHLVFSLAQWSKKFAKKYKKNIPLFVNLANFSQLKKTSPQKHWQNV